MTPHDITRLLDYLSLAYPNLVLADDTPMLWLQHFNETPVETVREAVHAWVDREKWAPTIAELRNECRVIEQGEWAAGAEAVPLQQSIEESVEERSAASEVRGAFFAAMRDALRVQAAVAHNHRGPGPCPACGGVRGANGDQRPEDEQGTLAAQVEAVFDAHRPSRWPGAEQLFDCSCVGGRGWVIDGDGRVAPCARCRVELRERWEGGHFRAGHRCRPGCTPKRAKVGATRRDLDGD